MPTTGPLGSAASPRYQKREKQGRIEAVSRDGIRIDGEWWNLSRRVTVDLSPYQVGDGVYVCADETADGAKRFLTEIGPLQPVRGPMPQARPAPAPAFVDDMPDDWPADDAPAGRFTAEQLAAHRLECLRIAAGTLTPGWTKRGCDPDVPAMLGIADALLIWLYRADDDR